MEHGFAKLHKGPDAFAGILHALGVPAPHLMAWLTIFTELFGGLAVFLGAFITLMSLPMAVVLVVAIFTVHLPYGFSSIKLMAVTAAGAQFGPVGYETNLLYLAGIAALVLGGPGPLALQALFRSRNRTWRSHGETFMNRRRLRSFEHVPRSFTQEFCTEEALGPGCCRDTRHGVSLQRPTI